MYIYAINLSFYHLVGLWGVLCQRDAHRQNHQRYPPKIINIYIIEAHVIIINYSIEIVYNYMYSYIYIYNIHNIYTKSNTHWVVERVLLSMKTENTAVVRILS